MAKIVLIGNYALINYLLRFDLNVMKKCALFFGTMQQGGCVCVCAAYLTVNLLPKERM